MLVATMAYLKGVWTMELLESMEKDYGLSPKSEHYACVVDLLGLVGPLNESKYFMNGLPENLASIAWWL